MDVEQLLGYQFFFSPETNQMFKINKTFLIKENNGFGRLYADKF